MHEASIAMSILETVIDQCRREGYHAIDSVRVRIGRGANILPDALAFAFDAAKLETPAVQAALIIEEVPLVARCRDCGLESESVDRLSLECPFCKQPSLQIVAGFEMEILDMEVH
ncbi:MAG: hydrogenase maturation nickel metallochaperone HypA [Desulfobacteraceae bacterium]|nr:hydrogenase maturation nickel metallochaperone HypA [Desulfobacteraceae bacterium]